MITKSPFYSKTIWLNFVGFVVSALVLFFPKIASVQTWLADSTHVALVGSVWAGLGIFLRFVSKDKIQLGD